MCSPILKERINVILEEIAPPGAYTAAEVARAIEHAGHVGERSKWAMLKPWLGEDREVSSEVVIRFCHHAGREDPNGS